MSLSAALLRRSRFCLVSDLDWTMVDHKDVVHDKLLRFNRLWLTRFAQDSLLVFSTGRSPQLFHALATEVPLLKPDILVCSVGTEILVGGQADAAWEAHLSQGWDRESVAAVAGRFPELVAQQVSEQRPHKVSYKLYAAGAAQAAGAVANLRSALAAAGLDAAVIFSGGEDLDVLPSRASKGKALAFLLEQMREAGAGGRGGDGPPPPPPPPEVLVCGDSGNDIELFSVPGVHGCVVANAHAELREWVAANGHGRIFEAAEDGPGGIVEALRHFGFARRGAALGGAYLRRRAVVALHHAFELWFNASDDEVGEAPAAVAGDDDDDEVAVEEAPAMLEAALGEGFRLIGPSGTVTSGPDLLAWFRGKGRGSRTPRAGHAAHAADPLAIGSSLLGRGGGNGGGVSPKAAGERGGEDGDGTAGRHRIWIDDYSEREVASGVWVVCYMELQQRFPAAGGDARGRRGRWSSAVLKEERAGGGGGGGVGAYKWVHLHECWAPDQLIRA